MILKRIEKYGIYKKKIALKKAKQINEEQSQPIAPTVTTQRIEKKKKKRKNC